MPLYNPPTTDATNLTSGTLNNARLPAAATTITSVGTLSSLAVTNGVTAATFTGALTGNASTASAVAAANLTGATLASGVTGSSLTSVGTLGSLAVTNATTTGSVTSITYNATSTGNNSSNYIKLGSQSQDSSTFYGYTAYGQVRVSTGYGLGIGMICAGAASPSGFTSNSHILFTANTTISGDIRSSANNTTTYNTSSDYRLKENITEISDAIERIRQLRPVNFQFKDVDNDMFYDGFLAHEVEEIAPYAVSGIKDAVTANGDIIPQMIDMSTMVGLLTAGIKDLDKRITELERKFQETT